MTEAHSKPRFGLPVGVVVGLGLLAAPRVVLHDLDLINEGTLINALLVFVPLLIWIGVAVWRSTNPFVSLLAAGGVYGVCLLVVHNVLWSQSWAGDPPRLGGNLEGRLPTAVEELFLRGAMSVTSLFTGLAVGTVCGAVAWAIARARSRYRGRFHPSRGHDSPDPR
ncbi:MAG: hypothetical protein ABW022_18300 [Actinoplanes sp.]